MKTSTRLALPFFYALLVGACSSDNDNYPKDYIGFERNSAEYTYDENRQEETITLKIIAGEKQEKDRKLKLNAAQAQVLKITDPHPIIAKGKKAVKVDVILYPKKLAKGQRMLRLTCLPDGKDAKVSEITIRLQKK